MYQDFFNLKEHPFSLTPDPRCLFLTERHQEALAHLLYGMTQDRGFVQLTGEVGTGKTTLCRCILEQVRLLTNLETGTRKLLQVILVGQPELHDTLARPGLRQLAQRIAAR